MDTDTLMSKKLADAAGQKNDEKPFKQQKQKKKAKEKDKENAIPNLTKNACEDSAVPHVHVEGR